MSTATESITDVARAFFEACDTGKGWAACSAYCHPNASFAAQAEPLTDIHTVMQYAEWMKDLFVFVPDGRYTIKSIATDQERSQVCVFSVFSGTHTADGGPMPPTGKSTNTDYVYVMDFDGGKISRMTKVWNAGWAMKELGWAG